MAKRLNTLRTIGGVSYWTSADPEELVRFINGRLRKEWTKDDLDDGLDPASDGWLIDLRRRRWSLRSLDVSRICMEPRLASNVRFRQRLEERSDDLERAISEYGVVI